MRAIVKVDPIEVDKALYDFVAREALPGTGVDEKSFWEGFASLAGRLAPRNAALLAKRDRLQASIDAWHRDHPGAQFDAQSYKSFLTDIGYLVPERSAFTVDTAAVDAEIAHIAGPQLVVPVSNARYALHVANARWGSLYDAIYGTDAIARGSPSRSGAYDAERGARVTEFARNFLAASFPLSVGAHRDAVGYRIGGAGLEVKLRTGSTASLERPAGLAGFQGEATAPSVVLLKHHGLHVEVHIDRQHMIGLGDPAGISGIVIESAVTTIQDCEDSVAATSTEAKVVVYRNWVGLMRGTF